jgi:two-component system chemotaxis sensor kinase CheA
MPRPRLKTYLLVSLILAAAAPLAYLGTVQVRRWREVQEQDADSELAFAARVLARDVAQVVDANIAALQMSAAEIGAGHIDDAATLQSMVRIHKQRFPGSVIVIFCDPSGKTIAAEPESMVGQNRNDRGDYQAMMRTGRTGISEVELGRVSRLPAIHVRTPVRTIGVDGRDAVVGNLGIALDLGLIQKLTSGVVNSLGNIQARVLDKRGRLITESEPQGRSVLRDLSGVAAYRAGPSAVVDLRDGTDERGTPVRAAVTRIEDHELGWVVALTRTHASIEEQAGRARRTTLIALALSLVVGLALALGLASWLARPIIKLATFAARVGAGEPASPPPLRRWDAREVGTLVHTVHSMFNQLRARNQELERLQQTLEARIEERTKALAQRNGEMGLLLDNLRDGVFILDAAGRMLPEHSAILGIWFGPLREGEVFHRFFGRHAPDFGAQAAVAWDQLTEDVVGLDLALEQLPKTLVSGGRRFAFSYQAIGADGGLASEGELPERYLVVVSDVTLELERQNLQRERRETLALFEHLLSDRQGFLAFEEEASAILARILRRVSAPATGTERAGAPTAADHAQPHDRDGHGDGDGDDSPERGALKRDLHTLKGNCMLFGLGSVATICHELESTLLDDGMGLGPADVAPLGERWTRLTTDVDRLLGARRRTIEMTPEEHMALGRAVQEGAPPSVLARMLHELTLEPVEQRFHDFAGQARQLATRLEKRVVVEILPGDLRLERGPWAPFWAVFLHAVRNAVDHGIEPGGERLAAGKPEVGHLTLSARRLTDGRRFVIEIADDGRGIDWDALRARQAERSGRDRPVELDRTELLFADGVSTAAAVTDISGRGIGMGALRAVTLQLGGEIAVQSERGAGTRLAITFSCDRCFDDRPQMVA